MIATVTWYEIGSCWIIGMLIGWFIGYWIVDIFFNILEYIVFRGWRK